MSNKEKEKNTQGKKYSRFLYSIIIAIIFFGLGYWLSGNKNNFKNNGAEEENKEVRQSGYEFINPLLECEIQRPPIFIPMEDK